MVDPQIVTIVEIKFSAKLSISDELNMNDKTRCTRDPDHYGPSPLLTPAQLIELADAVASRLATALGDRPRYLGREEMARELGVSVSAIDKWTRRGTIPAIKIDQRTVRFDPVQVHEALSKGAGAS